MLRKLDENNGDILGLAHAYSSKPSFDRSVTEDTSPIVVLRPLWNMSTRFIYFIENEWDRRDDFPSSSKTCNNICIFTMVPKLHSYPHKSLAALTSLLLRLTLPEQMALSICFLVIPNFSSAIISHCCLLTSAAS